VNLKFEEDGSFQIHIADDSATDYILYVVRSGIDSDFEVVDRQYLAKDAGTLPDVGPMSEPAQVPPDSGEPSDFILLKDDGAARDAYAVEDLVKIFNEISIEMGN